MNREVSRGIAEDFFDLYVVWGQIKFDPCESGQQSLSRQENTPSNNVIGSRCILYILKVVVLAASGTIPGSPLKALVSVAIVLGLQLLGQVLLGDLVDGGAVARGRRAGRVVRGRACVRVDVVREGEQLGVQIGRHLLRQVELKGALPCQRVQLVRC